MEIKKNPKSNLEWIIYQSSQLPGPFEYRLQGDFEEAAGEKRAGGMIKMKRPKLKQSTRQQSILKRRKQKL